MTNKQRPSEAVTDRPCLSRFTAILGFPQPTVIPCGLAVGHSGRHRYEAEWGDSAAEESGEPGFDHMHEVRISGYPRFANAAELLVDAHNGLERWTGAGWNEHVDAAERNGNMVTVRLIEADAEQLTEGDGDG